MKSLEEKQSLLQSQYDNILAESQARLAKVLIISKQLSGTMGQFLDNLNAINKYNEKEKELVVDAFEDRLNNLLNAQPDNSARLNAIMQQRQIIQTRIAKHKSKGETHSQSIYQDISTSIIEPRENVLLELVKLESSVGKLSDVVPTPFLNFPFATNALAKDIAVDDTHDISDDKPLLTKTGKPMNNSSYIVYINKFKWNDERAPHLIAEFMLEQKLILPNQLTETKGFLRTGKYVVKLLWDAKANVLTTMFYELKKNKILRASNNFIAERIAKVFVHRNNSTKPLITKNSVLADLKPTNESRRVPNSATHYPDIVNYLQSKF